MKRSAITVGLATTSAIVVLVALAYSTVSSRSDPIGASALNEASPAQETSQIRADRAAVDPQRLSKADSTAAGAYVSSLTDDAPRSGLDDEEAIAQWVRDDAVRTVPKLYSILLDNLELTPREEEALLEVLVEAWIASTKTRYSSGEGMDEQERLGRIESIIGDARLQQFVALELNLGEHGEVLHMQDILQEYEVPMTDGQMDRMLDVLLEVQNRELKLPGADAERGTIEYLEHQLARIDERDRLVFERAASELSAEQVGYLFEWYQHDSYRRAESLERQKKAIARGEEGLPLHYPGRTRPEDAQ